MVVREVAVNVIVINVVMKHIAHVVRMSVSRYRGRWFESRQTQCVVSLSKTSPLHCFTRLSSQMSKRRGHPCEGCSVL